MLATQRGRALVHTVGSAVYHGGDHRWAAAAVNNQRTEHHTGEHPAIAAIAATRNGCIPKLSAPAGDELDAPPGG